MVEINGYLDVAQMVLYGFWLFFALLLVYLFAENRREGYPLEDDVTGAYSNDNLFLPKPRTYILPHGHGVRLFPDPLNRDTRPVAATRTSVNPGSSLVPTGDPMVDGVGPGAWAERPDYPDADPHGTPAVQPMSKVPHFAIAPADLNPLGIDVIGTDGIAVGQVTDIWVDVMESYIRYYEVALADGTTRLLPMHFAKLRRKDRVPLREGARYEFYVHAITSAQFENVPTIKRKGSITMLEEERVQAYYGGGMLYALPHRTEPLL